MKQKEDRERKWISAREKNTKTKNREREIKRPKRTVCEFATESDKKKQRGERKGDRRRQKETESERRTESDKNDTESEKRDRDSAWQKETKRENCVDMRSRSR